MIVKFTIPGPPQGKRRPRTRVIAAKGRAPIVTIYSDPADVKREAEIRDIAREAMRGLKPFTGPVRLDIEAVFEPAPSWSKRKTADVLASYWHTQKPDYDNISKQIADSLNPDPKAKHEWDRAPFCLTDDAQVAAGETIKRWGSPARIEVVIQELEAPGALL